MGEGLTWRWVLTGDTTILAVRARSTNHECQEWMERNPCPLYSQHLAAMKGLLWAEAKSGFRHPFTSTNGAHVLYLVTSSNALYSCLLALSSPLEKRALQ